MTAIRNLMEIAYQIQNDPICEFLFLLLRLNIYIVNI